MPTELVGVSDPEGPSAGRGHSNAAVGAAQGGLMRYRQRGPAYLLRGTEPADWRWPYLDRKAMTACSENPALPMAAGTRSHFFLGRSHHPAESSPAVPHVDHSGMVGPDGSTGADTR